MPNRITRLARLLFALTLTLVVTTTPAAAQQKQDDRPYFDVPSVAVKKPWIQWTLGSVFIIGALLIAFKNPHRSHLD